MQLDQQVLDVFLVFCRVGACLVIVPGLSTARVPVRVRLYVAFVLSIVIALAVEPANFRMSGSTLLQTLFGECLVGLVIGSVTRLFIEALEFSGAAISNYIGLSWLAADIDGGEPQPPLAALLAAISTLLLLLMDFSHYLVDALVQSYADIPRSMVPDVAGMLRQFVGALGAAFVLGLQVSAPFLLYGLVLNAMFGILGKLVPQIPTFFISGPFIAFGGLFLVYLVSENLIHLLVTEFSIVMRQ